MSPPTSPAANAPSYELKSDLAFYCLPAANQDETRKLAWANSVCLMFLTVAIMSIKQPVFVLREAEPLPEPIPVAIVPQVEPPDQLPDQQSEEQPEEVVDDLVEVPAVAPVVVAAPQDVSFSVPLEGYTALATDARYVPPPPPVVPKAPPPDNVTKPIFKAIRFGGREFRKQPPPSYPDEFRRNRIGGTVEVLISVGTNGIPSKVEVGKSSGSPALDRHVTEFIRKEWRAEEGEAANYKIAITFL